MKKIDGKRKISWENTLIDKTVKRSISLFSIDTCSVNKLCLTLCYPMDCIVHGILQVRILEWVAVPSPGDLPNPRIESRSPKLQADSLPAESPGKPKNKRVSGGL